MNDSKRALPGQSSYPQIVRFSRRKALSRLFKDGIASFLNKLTLISLLSTNQLPRNHQKLLGLLRKPMSFVWKFSIDEKGAKRQASPSPFGLVQPGQRWVMASLVLDMPYLDSSWSWPNQGNCPALYLPIYRRRLKIADWLCAKKEILILSPIG